jgi:hypothetical protein
VYHSFRSGRWGGHKPQLITLSPETLHTGLFIVWTLHWLAEKRHRFCHNQTGVQEMVSCISVKACCQKKIVVALITHHTLALTSCNGILWINMVFSADLFLLFWEFMYPVRSNKVYLLNRITVGSVCTAYTPWRCSSHSLFFAITGAEFMNLSSFIWMQMQQLYYNLCG